MSRLIKKLPVIKQIKQIDYNYKSNVFGGIIEEDKKENAVWLFHNIVEKLAEYENLGSVEDLKQLSHELEVYKRALNKTIENSLIVKGIEFTARNIVDEANFYIILARKELEDERK